MNLFIKMLGNVAGTLESAEKLADGKMRLTIRTKRFGPFVVMLDAAEAEKVKRPAASKELRT